MNISNSLAIQAPAAPDVPRMKPPAGPASISDRRKFESAVASAQKASKADAEMDVDAEMAAGKKSASDMHRKGSKSEHDIAPIPALAPALAPVSVPPQDAAANSPSRTSGIVFEQSSAIDDAMALDNADADTADSAISAVPAAFPGQAGFATMGDAMDDAFIGVIGEASDAAPGENPKGIDSAALPSMEMDDNRTAGLVHMADAALPKQFAALANQTNTLPANETGTPRSMKEATDISQGSHSNDAGPALQMKPVAQTSPIVASLRSGDLQTMADAFEASVRDFERAGANWIGSAQVTLQSSALKGAAFQLVSDGRSLSILLTQYASAPIPITRRQESQLSETLTRKLGRNVSLNLGLSEIETPEHAEQQYE
ncbi:MAG TPA: hypothetical protein VGN04_12190 [Herbaspirillum sp.]